MAHFWEADWGEEDWEILFQNTPFFIEEFRHKILWPITGGGPVGPDVEVLDPNLFNRPDDQTRVFIYTPISLRWNPDTKRTRNYLQFKYRIEEVTNAILTRIPGVQATICGYIPLVYEMTYNYYPTLFPTGEVRHEFQVHGPDAAMAGKTARGSIMFQ
ncbi:hypothetical protein QC761_0076560 [Podospora bellae-mahoneyi]|uniref:Uncharacterized protein n=1 Tax=Podospora bellae-mahoneyi TaxID=2093777 RepID=A0ABR0FF34_9PEZI|nr:hypothetical protein QC761_0076560 [Podospora bellae-mahoneyi]